MFANNTTYNAVRVLFLGKWVIRFRCKQKLFVFHLFIYFFFLLRNDAYDKNERDAYILGKEKKNSGDVIILLHDKKDLVKKTTTEKHHGRPLRYK